MYTCFHPYRTSWCSMFWELKVPQPARVPLRRVLSSLSPPDADSSPSPHTPRCPCKRARTQEISGASYCASSQSSYLNGPSQVPYRSSVMAAPNFGSATPALRPRLPQQTGQQESKGVVRLHRRLCCLFNCCRRAVPPESNTASSPSL